MNALANHVAHDSLKCKYVYYLFSALNNNVN